MTTFKKKNLTELVGGDISSDGGDRNATNDSEIETGPVQKPYNDDSDYEKGTPTTTDRVFGRYVQNIPWFAIYSYGGMGGGAILRTNESEKKTRTLKKKSIEEIIEDLVKKNKSNDITKKGYNNNLDKLMDLIKDNNLSKEELEDLEKTIQDSKNKKSNKIQ